MKCFEVEPMRIEQNLWINNGFGVHLVHFALAFVSFLTPHDPNQKQPWTLTFFSHYVLFQGPLNYHEPEQTCIELLPSTISATAATTTTIITIKSKTKKHSNNCAPLLYYIFIKS